MEILTIETGIPGNPVGNQDIIDLIRNRSSTSQVELEGLILNFLERSGTENRFWRKSKKEPTDILLATGRRAIANIDAKEIDIVVSCGVTKYFAEPAHASLLSNELNLQPTFAFDVSDGCMGWMTAMSILSRHKSENGRKYGLIASHEFPMGETGAVYPECFTIRDINELRYKLPALTLGEATTFTLLDLSQSSKETHRIELPDGAEYCSMPYRNYEDFGKKSGYYEQPEVFHSHYSEMSKIGARPSLALLKKAVEKRFINLAPHSYTRSFEKIASLLDFETNILNYFAEYGNVATSSIPLNILAGIKRGELDLDKPTFGWCASAGMKTAVMEIPIAKTFRQKPV